MRHVRIVGDGTLGGTKVYEGSDEVRGVAAIHFTIDARAKTTAVVLRRYEMRREGTTWVPVLRDGTPMEFAELVTAEIHLEKSPGVVGRVA